MAFYALVSRHRTIQGLNMDIPFYRKDNPNDCGCAPVCLRMAAAHFGFEFDSIDAIHALTGAIGSSHYTLPWGMLIGAASFDLYATFISKNVSTLLTGSVRDISTNTGLSTSDIKNIANRQLTLCLNLHYRVTLLNWEDRFRNTPANIVTESRGVVIPTLWWGNQPHNVVLTNVLDNNILFHDPNNANEQCMPTDDFIRLWLHEMTDNDLIIVSDTNLSLQNEPGG